MKILYSAGQIEDRISTLVTEIDAVYPSESDKIFIVVMKGAMIFAADLMRHYDAEVQCVSAKSYGLGGKNRGELTIDFFNNIQLKNRDVFIIEDIIDSGHTIQGIATKIHELQPKSINVITFTVRAPLKKFQFIDHFFYGFLVTTKKFLIGYGLDCEEKHRTLPFVAIIN